MLSTAESEYVAAMHATKEAIWLRRLISKMFQPLMHPTTLYSDNQSAIALTHDGSYHACTKHIDICYHFIHFSVENGSISFLYCPSTDMIVDTLTKALPSIKAKHFAHELGLHPSVWGGSVVLLLFFVCCSQTDVDISILHNIQVDKICFDVSCTSVTDSIMSEVRQTLFILCIMYLHLVAYFYRCGIL